MAEALREPAADTDKNESVCALEAFRYAQTEDHGILRHAEAPGHRALGDRGHGKRHGRKHRTAENGQGKLAGAFTVVRLGANAAAARDPNKRPLLDKKEQLEQAIEKLKFDKAAMPAAEYKRQLTQLLLELAKTQEALDKREGKPVKLVHTAGRRNAPACPAAPARPDSGAGGNIVEGAALQGSQRSLQATGGKEPKNADFKVRWGRMTAGPRPARRRRRTCSAKRWKSRRTTPAR